MHERKINSLLFYGGTVIPFSMTKILTMKNGGPYSQSQDVDGWGFGAWDVFFSCKGSFTGICSKQFTLALEKLVVFSYHFLM